MKGGSGQWARKGPPRWGVGPNRYCPEDKAYLRPSLKLATGIALTCIGVGSALLLSSWPVDANWLASGGCMAPASCEYVLPFCLRILGLGLIALGSVVWVIKERRRRARPTS
jgi:hypothetical protein